MRGLFLVVALSQAAVMSGPLTQLLTSGRAIPIAAAIVFVVIMLTISWVILSVRESVGVATTVAVTSVLGMSLLSTAPVTSVDQSQLHRALVTSVAMFCIVSSTSRVVRVALPLLLILGFVSVEVTRLPALDVEAASVVANFIKLVTLLLTGLLILDPLRSAARTLDEQHARARGVELKAAQALARHRQLREIERLLHDEVLHSLRCVMQRPLGTALADNERALADSAVRLLAEHADEPASTNELSDELSEVARRSGLTVRLGIEEMHAPEHIVVAMTRAAAEALRNVELHSGTTEAVLLGTQEADGALMIKILDDGVGFTTPAPTGRSFGLTDSVVERLGDVDGTVRVTSAARQGTTVSLRWSPESGEPMAPLNALNLGRVLANVALPFCFGALALGVLMGPFGPHPAIAVLASLLVALSGYHATRELRRHGTVTTLTAWALSVEAIGLTWFVAWQLIPVDTPDSDYYWLAGGINALALVVIFSRPLRDGLSLGLTLLATTVGALFWRFGWWLVLTNFLDVLASSLIAVAGGLFLRIAIDQLTAHTRLTANRILAGEVSRVSAESRSRVVHADLAHIRSQVSDFLTTFRQGGVVGPTDRRRAKALEAEVRDQLSGGSLSPGLRHSLYVMRISGWVVDLRIAPEDLPSHQRALAHVIELLEPLAPQAQRVILSARNATVTAVLPSPEHALEAQLSLDGPGVSVITDPDFIRITSTGTEDEAATPRTKKQ